MRSPTGPWPSSPPPQTLPTLIGAAAAVVVLALARVSIGGGEGAETWVKGGVGGTAEGYGVVMERWRDGRDMAGDGAGEGGRARWRRVNAGTAGLVDSFVRGNEELLARPLRRPDDDL